jgi:hypothetical protein
MDTIKAFRALRRATCHWQYFSRLCAFDEGRLSPFLLVGRVFEWVICIVCRYGAVIGNRKSAAFYHPVPITDQFPRILLHHHFMLPRSFANYASGLNRTTSSSTAFIGHGQVALVVCTRHRDVRFQRKATYFFTQRRFPPPPNNNKAALGNAGQGQILLPQARRHLFTTH